MPRRAGRWSRRPSRPPGCRRPWPRGCRSSSPSRERGGAACATPCRGRIRRLARMTPRAGADALRAAVAFDDRADHRTVDVGDQLRHRRVQPQRDVVLLHRQPQPRRQRLPDRRHPVAEYPRPEHPPDQLHQHGLATPVLPHLVEQPKVLGSEPDPLRRQCQRMQQVLLLVAELAQVDGGHVDGAAERRAAGQLRVVVGISGLPDELEPRATFSRNSIISGAVSTYCRNRASLTSPLGDLSAGTRRRRRRRERNPPCVGTGRRAPRCRRPTARWIRRTGPTSRPPGCRARRHRGERGGHAAAAGTDDENVDGRVEFVLRS